MRSRATESPIWSIGNENSEVQANQRPDRAVASYARRAGLSYPDELLQPPPLVRTSLEQRFNQIDVGDWDDDAWAEQCEEWTLAADARYRPIVARRSATPAVRVGVKDTIDVADFPTGLGLRWYRHHPKASAPAIESIEQGDGGTASVIAKLVSTELNIGVGSGCVNPCFPHIDPAGSSTGAGVAVAAGLCDLAVGTDVLGSVRWPAGQCGTVGLRMSHAPDLLDGVFPLSPPMDAIGLVARSAADLALLWRRLGLGSLVSEENRSSSGVEWERRRYRVGVVDNIRHGCASSEMLETVDKVSDWLADDGHVVDEVRLGDLWRFRGDAWQLCARQARDGYQLWRRWITVPLLDSTHRALDVGAKVDDERYAEILENMVSSRREAPAMFGDDLDAWLLPLDPSAPPDIRVHSSSLSTIPMPGEPDYDRRIGYTPIASFAGLPAITVPAQRSRINGAPLGVQLVGPRGSEERLIHLARRVEQSAGELEMHPM
ncbi:amidase [Saccharopolyspora sp. HNM0986]|uniref:amidase n=1 Tax=Saccharopolyspora galaxeae TaxID=2781241 RepID=UPI00190E5206|nr:amidase [Saccharopolyspora sp. HNM0986]MBK0870243.1 amidase [Saccharopolyspora sp. HNM0986]